MRPHRCVWHAICEPYHAEDLESLQPQAAAVVTRGITILYPVAHGRYGVWC